MAESIAVYFATATSKQIAALLDTIGKPAMGEPPQATWVYPRDGEHDVLIYEHGSFSDYEDTEVRRIKEAFDGKLPVSAYIIELRRSKGSAAFDTAERLVKFLLERFRGLVDELCGDHQLWSLKEIETGARRGRFGFLDVYRQRLI